MVNPKRNYTEKRNFMRMNLTAALKFTQLHTGTAHHGVTRNLSGDGLLFETSTLLTAGEDLQLMIKPAAGQFAPLTATGRVTRIDKIAADNYLIACTITEIH